MEVIPRPIYYYATIFRIKTAPIGSLRWLRSTTTVSRFQAVLDHFDFLRYAVGEIAAVSLMSAHAKTIVCHADKTLHKCHV